MFLHKARRLEDELSRTPVHVLFRVLPFQVEEIEWYHRNSPGGELVGDAHVRLLDKAVVRPCKDDHPE